MEVLAICREELVGFSFKSLLGFFLTQEGLNIQAPLLHSYASPTPQQHRLLFKLALVFSVFPVFDP